MTEPKTNTNRILGVCDVCRNVTSTKGTNNDRFFSVLSDHAMINVYRGDTIVRVCSCECALKCEGKWTKYMEKGWFKSKGY